MCGFCNVWVYVCLGFLICGSVYVWIYNVWLFRQLYSCFGKGVLVFIAFFVYCNRVKNQVK